MLLKSFQFVSLRWFYSEIQNTGNFTLLQKPLFLSAGCVRQSLSPCLSNKKGKREQLAAEPRQVSKADSAVGTPLDGSRARGTSPPHPPNVPPSSMAPVSPSEDFKKELLKQNTCSSSMCYTAALVTAYIL